MIADSFDVIPKGYCGYVLEGGIFDGAKALRLGLNTDADKAAGVEDVKSTSGMILTLEGPNSFWPRSNCK